MFPIALNITKIKIALIGDGDGFLKRQKQLQELGATHVTYYHSTNLPSDAEYKNFHVLLIVDIDDTKTNFLNTAYYVLLIKSLNETKIWIELDNYKVKKLNT